MEKLISVRESDKERCNLLLLLLVVRFKLKTSQVYATGILEMLKQVINIWRITRFFVLHIYFSQKS